MPYIIGFPKLDKHLALHRTGFFGAVTICLREYKLHYIMQLATKEDARETCDVTTRTSGYRQETRATQLELTSPNLIGHLQQESGFTLPQ